MNNIFKCTAVAAFMGLSGLAMAAGTAFTSNQEQIDSTECSLLGSTVTINLSANISAAYQCDVADAAIRIGTCHAAGSRAEKTVTCVNSGTVDAPVWNHADCDANTTSVTFADFSGFQASSTGGSVGEAALGGACSSSTVTTLEVFD